MLPPAMLPRTLLPNTLAFLSSCWVMVIELVASRLVARYIGSSVYTWTAVIGVILAGISLGNHLGGRIADRHEPRRAVGFLFCLAALLVLLALALHPLLGTSLSGMEVFPWSFRIVLVVGAIFFLPAVALGTIGPVAAKMALQASDQPGRAIGNVYAWGAIGSIVGTFLTGFWLMGLMGTVGIMATSAGMLGLIGLILLGVPQRNPGSVPAGAAALMLLVIATIAPWPLPGRAAVLEQAIREREIAWQGLLVSHVSDSPYYHIVVRHDRSRAGHPRATLVLDHLVHGFWVPQDPGALEYDYERVYARLTEQVLTAAGHTDPSGAGVSALCIGGGAYTFPRWVTLHLPAAECVVAEIDPAVVAVNEEALGLRAADGITTLIGDARAVLREQPAAEFDLIYGDAFNDFTVPYHLTTVEFLTQLRTLLRPGGAYLLNCIDLYDPADPGIARFVGAMTRTCQEVFGTDRVAVYASIGEVTPTPGKPVRCTYVIACLNSALTLLDPAHPRPGLQLTPDTWELRAVELTGPAMQQLIEHSPLLTDDFAPVEQLLAPVAASRG